MIQKKDCVEIVLKIINDLIILDTSHIIITSFVVFNITIAIIRQQVAEKEGMWSFHGFLNYDLSDETE